MANNGAFHRLCGLLCLRILAAPAQVSGLTSHRILQHQIQQPEHKASRKNSLTQILLERGDTSVKVPDETVYIPREIWYETVEDWLLEVTFGFAFIVFAIPLLWFNESRLARKESLVFWAKTQCRTVNGDKCDPDNRNWLVHLEGEPLSSAAPIEDKYFDVRFEMDCIKLSRLIEVFQIIEHESTAAPQKSEGSKDPRPAHTFTYTEEWSGVWHDSVKYTDESKRRNRMLPGLELGQFVQTCGCVELGGGFTLPISFVDRLDNFQCAGNRLGQSISLNQVGNAEFRREEDGFFYYRNHQIGGGRPGPDTPQVGDVRVRFEYVPAGSASVVALQVECEGTDKDTFMPYRLIPRGLCGSSEELEKSRLLAEAQKSSEQLVEEACFCSAGLPACCCFGFSAGFKCWSSDLMPEIYEIIDGRSQADDCIRHMEAQQMGLYWGWRILGWILMFGGGFMLLDPMMPFLVRFETLNEIAYLLGDLAVWFFCLQMTTLVSALLIAFSYLSWRPILTLVTAGAGGVVFYMVTALLEVAGTVLL